MLEQPFDGKTGEKPEFIPDIFVVGINHVAF